MWQKGFPSPHLYYFSPARLESLVKEFDFLLLRTERLPTVELGGLLSRLLMNRTMAPVNAYLVFSVIAPASFFLNRFGSPDIVFQVFRRSPSRNGME
jgi:hypothetical protein